MLILPIFSNLENCYDGKASATPEQPLYYGVNLDQRIRSNHPLRIVNELIDFDFAYTEVQSCYGNTGNETVPPPVILKLMLLLVFYNVRSERELMDTVPERMDWLGDVVD